MSVVAVIPARMGSTRFPDKPLADIHGLPMIIHCYLRARMAQLIDEVFVATCDDEIAAVAESYGAPAIMTSARHLNAIDRTAEAVETLCRSRTTPVDIVVLVQGDEPLLNPAHLDALVTTLQESPKARVSNVMVPFTSRADFENPNNVKVVADANRFALYMSREPIPSTWKTWSREDSMMQTGLLALAPETLDWFASTPPAPLEVLESVDMLRMIHHGVAVQMVPMPIPSIGVDTVTDLEAARASMASDQAFTLYRDVRPRATEH